MARPKKPKVSLAERRGVFPPESCSNDWEMTLVQMPGRAGPVDLDELVDRLIERGVVGEARRDIGAEVHAGTVATPAGPWALLVALPGQSWAYLRPGLRSDDLAAEVASKAGLRVIHAGYSDFANATGFSCIEGDEVLARFEACGMDENSRIVEAYTRGFDENEVIFTGSRLPKEWLRQFQYDSEVQEALTKEFDAFIPIIYASGFDDVVEVWGIDHWRFKPRDYLRIDLIGFGETRLEPAPADLQLRDAINAGDVEAIRAAVAAGADLRFVPVWNVSPLALSLRREGESRKPMVATLLELGADPNSPVGEPVIHALLDTLYADEAELIDLLELLTARGADVNARGKEMLSRAQTPLHVVARKGWLAVAKYLVAKGADPRATDDRGRPPRQSAEAARESIRSFGEEEAEAKYAPIITFLADAEAGRPDLDVAWQEDAAEASRRELRRRREMKVALGKIGEGFKALGKISGDHPSAEALVDAVTFAQPDEIHLTPDDAEWPSDTESARAEAAAVLVADGFEPIGRYAIPELPKIRVDAYHHPRDHIDAALYDAAGQSILDLVRHAQDGARLTVTNNTTRPEAHFDLPDRRTIRLPGAPAAELLKALRAEPEPEPEGGAAAVSSGDFAARFEDAYRREIKARKRRVRRK